MHAELQITSTSSICLQPVEWSERVMWHHTYLFELSLLAAASF
jgi:hypothetical protein